MTDQLIKVIFYAGMQLPSDEYFISIRVVGVYPDGAAIPVQEASVNFKGGDDVVSVPFTFPAGKHYMQLQFGYYPRSEPLPRLQLIQLRIDLESLDGLFPTTGFESIDVAVKTVTQTRFLYTYDVEPYITFIPLEPEPVPPPVPEPEPSPPTQEPSNLPWPFNLVAEWANGVVVSINNTIWAGLNNLISAVKSIGDFFANPAKAIVDNFSAVADKAVTEGAVKGVAAIADINTQSPEYKVAIESELTKFGDAYFNKIMADFDHNKFHKSVLSPQDASNILTGAGVGVIAALTAGNIAGLAVETASIGQIEGVFNLVNGVINATGINKLSSDAVMLPLTHLLLEPADMWWKSQFTPYIPSTSDLINMVVKEKISLDVFKVNMKYQGFDETWSQRIWDAHFMAPSLGQLLTSWRRNHITTEQLDKYEILVDLDPAYKVFWEDQRFLDPSITMARFMFETGAIDANGVEDIVKRNGLFPADIKAITDYIVRFQERLYRRRVILTAGNGYRLGVFSADRVREAVKDAGYSNRVADWVIHNENLKREIAAAKTKPEKDVLLTLSLLKDAFVHGDVDEAYVVNYFMDKGYDPFEVNIAVKAYKREKDKYEAKVSEA